MIRTSEHASDGMIGIEDSPEIELSLLLLDYRRHAGTDTRREAASPDTTSGNVATWSGLRRWFGRVDGEDRLRRRQRRRYADGDLGLEHSFIFRSPQGGLNVRAQNLVLFVRLADAVDDGTWLYHLRRGDYSRWFGQVIQDETLAREAARLEGLVDTSAGDSRHQITSVIAQRYLVSI